MKRTKTWLMVGLIALLLTMTLSTSALAGSDLTQPITRAELAETFYGVFMPGEKAPDQGFTDIGPAAVGEEDPCTDQQRQAINALTAAGIISGETPTTFNPTGNVTRAEAAVLLWRATGCKSNPAPAQVYYTDVTMGDWFSPAIHALTAAGILQGGSDGAFRPYDLIKGIEVSALLTRYQDSEFSDFSPGVTRVEMVVAAYENFKDGPLQDQLSGNFTSSFSDIACCTPIEQAAIAFFEELGVVQGYNETPPAFHPYAAASNLQIAMFLQRCAQLTDSQTASLLSGEENSDPIAQAFDFLQAQGINVDAAKSNPHAPGLVADLPRWNDGLIPQAPSFSPEGGNYTAPLSVSISGPEQALIYYTTDGRTPTTDSNVYSQPIFISQTATLKAIAVQNNLLSPIASAEYTLPWIYIGGNSSNRHPSGGNSQTVTETNKDGSVTTTVTNAASGTVTETTQYADGSQKVVESKKDGVVITTVKDAQGNQIKTVENADGSQEIAMDNLDGSGSLTTVDVNGQSQTTVHLSQKLLNQAAGQIITLPMPEVRASQERQTAAMITIDLPAASHIIAEIPVTHATAGTVAVIVHAGGSESVVKTCLLTENGITTPIGDGDTIKIIDNGKTFLDVADNYWGAEAIDFAVSRELFAGVSANLFQPEAPTTRAMLVTVLARLDGANVAAGNNWYDAGRQWAMQNGISDGSQMEQNLTREQLITMLYRYGQNKGYDMTAKQDLSAYADADHISPYAQEAFQWAAAQGLISGMGDGTLLPQGTASRAQLAAILQRFISAAPF